MQLELRNHLICEACGKPWDEHDPQCPRGRIIQIVESQQLNVKCPCCRGQLEINDGDFFECRKCATQFCSGVATAGEDATTLPKHMLIGGAGMDFDRFTGTRVAQMTGKGKGEFKIDRALRQLEKLEEEWKARK